MIVAGVVAIVAAIGLPVAITYIRLSHDNACDENKAQIETACQMTLLQGAEETDLDKLCDGTHGASYLREKPVCPLGGTYVITCANGIFTVTCTKDSEHHQGK